MHIGLLPEIHSADIKPLQLVIHFFKERRIIFLLNFKHLDMLSFQCSACYLFVVKSVYQKALGEKLYFFALSRHPCPQFQILCACKACIVFHFPEHLGPRNDPRVKYRVSHKQHCAQRLVVAPSACTAR